MTGIEASNLVRGVTNRRWRSVPPVGRRVSDVKEVIVGEMPEAWRRARRVPGKTYYASLDEAVRACRERRRA